MKDDARETYIRAKQKAQHQVKIVLDQLHTNYGFRQYEIMPQESPEQYGPGRASHLCDRSAEDPKYLNEMLRGEKTQNLNES